MVTGDLIQRAQSGDESAFEELYRTMYAPVYRFIFLRLKNRDDTEDVTQDVFIKFLRALPTYRAEGAMLPYLYTTAKNAVIDHLRKRKPDYDDEALLRLASGGPTPEESARLGQEVGTVMSLLGQLSEAEEAALKLKYLDGLETHEVASLLGKTDEAVRQLLSRGIRHMRSLLEGTGSNL